MSKATLRDADSPEGSRRNGHRAPNHISKTVRPIVKIGPPNWTRTPNCSASFYRFKSSQPAV